MDQAAAGTRRASQVARLAGPAAIAYASVFALLQLGIVLTYPGRSGGAWWPLAATACYLPLFLWQVWSAAVGDPPPAWTVAALAVPIGVALPASGGNWLPTLVVVAVAAMLTLRWPWSLLVAIVLAAAQAPLALLLDSAVPAAASYYVLTFCWRMSALFVPIWLLRALRQLAAARDGLAANAVVDERLRIDREIRTAVGSALEAIAVHGDAAAGRATTDPAAAERHIRTSVDVSRRALADARRLLSGYREASLGAEVDAAAALLRAAGIEITVELAAADRDLVAGESVRVALRRATAAALHDDSDAGLVIRVTRDSGRGALGVRIESLS